MLETEVRGTVLVARPVNDIVSAASTGFLADLKALDLGTAVTLQIDFSKVGMIDSMGLGSLIVIHKDLKAKGRKLQVTKAKKEILGLMQSMGLHQHFEII